MPLTHKGSDTERGHYREVQSMSIAGRYDKSGVAAILEQVCTEVCLMVRQSYWASKHARRHTLVNARPMDLPSSLQR